MKRWLFTLSVLSVLFFTTLTLISSHISFPLILPTGKVLNPKFYDYAGITHAHTILSTGSGFVSELTKAAARDHCSFLIITDLNPPPRKEGMEGYRDDVLVIWSGEYSYLASHLLAYDLPEAQSFKGPGQAQIFFNDLLEKKPRDTQRGFLIAAHPLLPQHSFENLLLPGLTGMEVLNLDSLWHTKISGHILSVLWSFLLLPFNPDLAYLRLLTEPTRELALWDDILTKKRFVGFSGNDATANAIPFPGKSFPFPSYGRSFRLLKNHILLKSELTGSYKEDRRKVISALRAGNFYFSIDLIGDPAGFYFVGNQRSREVLPGENLKISGGPVTLTVELGREIEMPHEIILFRNGERIASSNSAHLSYVVKEPGAYRTTVRVIPTLPIPDGLKWMTWIYSNAIRVD